MPNPDKLSKTKIQTLLKDIPDWSIENRKDILQLERNFTFNDFISAMEFSNKIAGLAEKYNHHPSILIEWGQVTVTWWSHSIGGLQKIDFIMSASTDHLYSTMT